MDALFTNVILQHRKETKDMSGITKALCLILCGLLAGVSSASPQNNVDLKKLSAETKARPKIGVTLVGVPWDSVEKCIGQIKEDRLGDIVCLFGVGACKPRKVSDEERDQFFQSWARTCKNQDILFCLEALKLDKQTAEAVSNIAGSHFLAVENGEYGNGAIASTFDGKVKNMQEARDTYVSLVRKELDKFKGKGYPAIMNEEMGPIGHGEALEAGADISFSEHASCVPISLSSARGATKAYGKPLWGAWLNVEFYGGAGFGGYGPPYDDSYTSAHHRRLMLDYNLSYISGADLIILQDCLFDITIGHDIDKKKPAYDMNSPQCRGFRETAKKFYSYVQTHERPKQGPTVDIGVVYGNLDGTKFLMGLESWINPNLPVWSQSGKEWKSTIEQGWNNLVLANILTYGPVIPGWAMRYSGTPYGQIDIVPACAPDEVFAKYKTLLFLGWNTMTPEMYRKLTKYVKGGGRLFMSLPQLSQQVERKPQLELVKDGDLRDLFGVRVTGKHQRKGDLKASQKIGFDKKSSLGCYDLSAGKTLNVSSDFEWADMKIAGARVLASTEEGAVPVLIEKKTGKGTAFLFANYSFSPTPPELIEPFVRATPASSGVELLGDLPERKNINYAVYSGKSKDEETQVLLVNIDWTTPENVRNVKLRIGDMAFPVAVREGSIKCVNAMDGIALTVDDEGISSSLARPSKNSYAAKLTGTGKCVVSGYMKNTPRVVTLDGKPAAFSYDPASHLFEIRCQLKGKHVLALIKTVRASSLSTGMP